MSVKDMNIRKLHPWNITPREAAAVQERLYPLLNLERISGTVRNVAGVDVSFSRGSDIIWAGVVVFSFPEMKKLEEEWIREHTRFPYIPGMLSFREIPGIIEALKKLRIDPDLILCDGQGIAHPRGVGLASHLGLILDRPTIGCAKSRLIGWFSEVGSTRGDYSRLLHNGRVIGAALRTRTGVKPMFISPGNRITLKQSLRIVMECCLKYRIPEPIRQAHMLVSRRRQIEETVS
jgi:deoxyribonuclease V